MLQKTLSTIGIVGTILCLILYIREPSFPTPDKILIFLIFVFMIFHQATEMLKRFLPFVLILLAYESFRGLADGLNKRVEYMWMVDVDRWIGFGTLPTTTLQKWWWHGQTAWYDYVFYLPYMLHFVIPICLALFVWKYRPKKYWAVVISYITVSFCAFFVFLAFPAAPPWMTSDMGMIEPLRRVSSDVWWSLGIHDFPSFYNQISPNAVAAVPSLHAAYATLFALYVTTLFRSKWRYLSWIYPLLIYVGTVYQGEHYAIDEVLGALLAVAVFLLSPRITGLILPISRAFGRMMERGMQVLIGR